MSPQGLDGKRAVAGVGNSWLRHVLPVIPATALWSSVLWENFVNTGLRAPYAANFLMAPLIVAGAKAILLYGGAWMLGTRRYPKSELFQKLMVCWFLSSLIWTAVMLINTYVPGHWLDAGRLFDAIVHGTAIQGWPTYALTTAVYLAIGWILAKHTAGFLSEEKLKPAEPSPDVILAVMYCIFNGMFAWLIRL